MYCPGTRCSFFCQPLARVLPETQHRRLCGNDVGCNGLIVLREVVCSCFLASPERLYYIHSGGDIGGKWWHCQLN